VRGGLIKIAAGAAGVIAAIVAGTAFAAGSLAIDTLQGKEYGFSFNRPSYGVADERAKRECGPDCSIVKRFENQCAAFAADQAAGSTVYGWWQGAATSAVVQQRALSECRSQGGSSCIVRAWGCDTIKANDRQANAKTPKQDGNAFTMLGEWTLDYTTARGYSANGTVRVTSAVGNGVFRGVIALSYTSNGVTKQIQEDALITVQGETISINASNPVYVSGSGNYNADNYSLNKISNNVLKGVNNDNAGAGGIIVLIKK